MKARWKRFASGIDALALRERVFIFLAALMLLTAGADALWISPLWAEHKAARTALQRQAGETKALREQLRTRLGPAAGGAADESSLLRDEVARGRHELADAAREIARLSSTADDTARLPDLLDKVLRRDDRLTLIKLATVNDSAPDAAPRKGLRRQGVDLTLAGRYADLVRDLAALEAAMPGLRWGALQLSAPLPSAAAPAPAADERVTLTVRVFLVGVIS
jgi:MSHA biogenesis protein MshJ